MPASATTPPPTLQENRIEEIPQQQVFQASETWFQRSQLFYANFTSDESIKQREFSLFAKIFKLQRLRLNYSVKKVAKHVRCSETTIHRFEALKLSLSSMRKWKPLLQDWFILAAKSTQVSAAKSTQANRLVSNKVSQKVGLPLEARQGDPTKDPEVLEKDKDKGLWRPWGPQTLG